MPAAQRLRAADALQDAVTHLGAAVRALRGESASRNPVVGELCTLAGTVLLEVWRLFEEEAAPHAEGGKPDPDLELGLRLLVGAEAFFLVKRVNGTLRLLKSGGPPESLLPQSILCDLGTLRAREPLLAEALSSPEARTGVCRQNRDCCWLSAPVERDERSQTTLLLFRRNGEPFQTKESRALRPLLPLVRSVLESVRAGQSRQADREGGEEAASAGDGWWRLALDCLPDGVGVSRDGNLLYANQAFWRMVGLEPNSLGAARCENIPALRRILAAGHMAGEGDQEVCLEESPAGGLHRITVRAVPDATGGHTVVYLLRDVSHSQAVGRHVAQSERLATLGQMVASVAHELNNALTGVVGFTELLAGEKLPTELGEIAGQVHEQARRAGRTVKDLLALARHPKTGRKAVQVNDLVSKIVSLRAYDFRVKNIDVRLSLDPNLPSTWADEDRLQQVLLNLVLNAEQAMEGQSEGGSLTLTTTHRDDPPQIVVAIGDSGPGVSPEIVHRIFEPFFTTKGPERGTGLGLAICSAIVAEHQGRIYCNSQKGQGATFFVELPVCPPDGRQDAGSPQTPSTRVAAPARVLAVDDEPAILDLLRKVLTPEGLEVHVALTGEEALELARARPFDAALLDLRMPGVDGWAVYRSLREQRHPLAEKVVFLTGDSVNTEAGRMIAETNLPCIHKPFDRQELIESLQAVLSRHPARGAKESATWGPRRVAGSSPGKQ